MIKGSVQGQELLIGSPVIVADTINYLTAEFIFRTSDWDGLVKIAHFSNGTNSADIELIDDQIPSSAGLNLSEGKWTVSLTGHAYDGEVLAQRITTTQARLTVKPSAVPDGEPIESLPSYGEEIIGKVQEIENDVSKLKESLNFNKSATQGYVLTASDDGNGSKWSPVDLPTDQQTAEAVAKWLNAHPEATTTVENGSITEAKFTDELKLKTLKDYVTPQMYGAKGDDITDDSTAFQLALNSGKPVYVPEGTYYLANVINNPDNIYLFGAGRTKSKMRLNDSLLSNRIVNSVIRDLRFYCDQMNSLTVFPETVRSCIIEKCSFQYFENIFYRIENISTIRNNAFTFIQGCFCENIIDSFILNNYINGPKYKNPQQVCFGGTIRHSVISNNFIDFFYKVFAPVNAPSIASVTVTGNIFDVCYCIFYQYILGVTFTGNAIANLKKRSDWDVSGNEDMNTKPWCVIKRPVGSSPLVSSYFGNNSFTDDIDMYISSDTYGYPTRDVVIDEALPPEYFDYKAYKSGNARDFENIKIRPMLKRTVTTLPTPSLSSSCTTFNFDEVMYNGNLYINVNGEWVQITNNIIT